VAPNMIISEVEDFSWDAGPLKLLGAAVGGRNAVIGSRPV
jgi:hypothetical protein